ncbi:MAG TPA: serine/threonine-protein kinase [Bryobacteraceae bacterium]|nr:serine/threonine-protein kinase [Bryobacteraceae bacterium]
MIGQAVGNYKILSALGEGGMGTVYKAVDVMLEREVAIKMLRPEIASQPQIVERFRSEAVTLAKLNHPSIATLYSFFRQGDQFFMVMEFVAGQTLDHLIRQSGALPADRAASVLAQALDGIGHAHAMGILHRDLKPSNIMLPATGGVKVMDFGIARLLNAARMTRTGGLVGTLEYIAPERVRGQEADLRSDLYSMGIVLFEMLTGRVPFHSDTEYELMRAQLEQAPPTLASLGITTPPDVEAALMRSLAKNPEERFSSAAEFRAALVGPVTPTQDMIKPTRLSSPAIKETRMADSIPPTAMAPAATVAAPAAASTRKPSLAIYGAIAAVVLVLGAGGAYWALHRNSLKPAPPAPVVTPSNPPAGPVATTTSPSVPPPAPADPHPLQIPNLDVPAVPVTPPSKPVVKRASKGSTGNTSSSTAADTPTPQQPVEQAPAPVIAPPRPVPVAPPPATPPVNQAPAITALSEVQTLCIAPMMDNLNGYIASELARQLGSRFRIVSTPSQADAVMKGTATAGGGLGRTIGVQSDAAASVVITDRSGTRVLWSDSVTARRVLGGVIRKGGPSGLAEHIVADLRRALR